MVYAVLWGSLLIAIFMITYKLNKDTPIPTSAQAAVDQSKCSSCSQLACSHHQLNKEDTK